jgi:hypothetical protein
MTNDKDSAVPDILERLQDEADLCRNDGADDIAQTLDDAINEIEALRQLTQSDGLREALEGVLPYVLTNYFQCDGDKCRHPTCASCFGEDFAESQSDKANLALTKAKAALAALQEQSK